MFAAQSEIAVAPGRGSFAGRSEPWRTPEGHSTSITRLAPLGADWWCSASTATRARVSPRQGQMFFPNAARVVACTPTSAPEHTRNESGSTLEGGSDRIAGKSPEPLLFPGPRGAVVPSAVLQRTVLGSAAEAMGLCKPKLGTDGPEPARRAAHPRSGGAAATGGTPLCSNAVADVGACGRPCPAGYRTRPSVAGVAFRVDVKGTSQERWGDVRGRCFG